MAVLDVLWPDDFCLAIPFTCIHLSPTRWALTSYKWSYTPYKWPCKWVTGGYHPRKWSYFFPRYFLTRLFSPPKKALLKKRYTLDLTPPPSNSHHHDYLVGNPKQNLYLLLLLLGITVFKLQINHLAIQVGWTIPRSQGLEVSPRFGEFFFGEKTVNEG